MAESKIPKTSNYVKSLLEQYLRRGLLCADYRRDCTIAEFIKATSAFPEHIAPTDAEARDVRN